MTNTRRLIIIVRIFILAHATVATSVLANESIYGYYSNVSALHGEPSGIEMLLINDGRGGKCDQTILVQFFEGWPQYPELLDCCHCTKDNIRFYSPTRGAFIGTVENSHLIGNFIDMNYWIKLPKGHSFWQK